jgi:hypothetical protein
MPTSRGDAIQAIRLKKDANQGRLPDLCQQTAREVVICMAPPFFYFCIHILPPMRIFLFVLCAAFLLSCGPSNKPDDQAFQNSLDSLQTESNSINEELIRSVLQQIPSPLEISVLLKQSGKQYDNTLLNPPDNVGKYNTNYKMALNLGIYGTDLGYTNIYQKNQDGIKYLATIESLADGLNIAQFFDIKTIGRLAANSKNLDSLLLLTTQNFNAINDYLQNQNRSSLSVLLLTGGWMEAMQITCQMALKDPSNRALQETIGEQKLILEQIVVLLSFYPDDANMTGLAKDLDELKKVYDKVNINYTYKEATVEVVNGVAIVKDNSTTTIDITPADVTAIQGAVASIRNKIIS